MHSPSKDSEEPTSSSLPETQDAGSSSSSSTAASQTRPPAKRPFTSTVIEISDTESDDSDVCAVNSYQASADEVKRIRGTEYSSSSSSSDYSSDSEESLEDDSILIEDKVQIKVVKKQLNPRAHRMDDPKLNPSLKSEELKAKLKNHWVEKKDYSCADVTLTCDPFRLCLLHELLANEEIINNIVDDMNTMDWSRKKMDLYEFHQTTDLSNLTWQRSIRGIYELLKTEVMSWVSEVTGLQLESVSASCSLYGPGDHLLVHDDLLADRRVAFILYLAPHEPPAPPPAPPPASPPALSDATELTNGDKQTAQEVTREVTKEAVQEAGLRMRGWAEHMGGALELLSQDAEGRAGQVVRRVFPRNNMLAFFKVGHDSFHQVAEVLSLELPRLSINGWFHGPATSPARASPPTALAPGAPVPPHSEPPPLSEWVQPAYLKPRVRAEVQAQMERASEVSLHGLLPPDKYRDLLDALDRPEVQWEEAGPAERRRYRRVSERWAAAEGGGAVRDLLRLAGSAPFVRLLADCTDLQLTGYTRLELQQWRPGDFTLLPGRAEYGRARLEALLYCGVARRVCGGGTTYVSVEEEGGGEGGALLTVPPHSNALSLVYCDAGAAGFTKYYGKLPARRGDRFYLLSCTYVE
ncbi:2-oxoglutarate and iron-dependent oxygenase domain-containing protein 1 [Papilio machaon]|uniref:uS12 prolyl 3-hydroxylase n=1 Tax=Papilio machaon TaxID=76193 RepID=A0A0N1PFI0_PAPMA|nr:2-oxoglutarate and iron-dependent oxygenase domain-containing protein 1 [Papilio machaon]